MPHSHLRVLQIHNRKNWELYGKHGDLDEYEEAGIYDPGYEAGSSWPDSESNSTDSGEWDQKWDEMHPSGRLNISVGVSPSIIPCADIVRRKASSALGSALDQKVLILVSECFTLECRGCCLTSGILCVHEAGCMFQQIKRMYRAF